jgi:hypothetical protein
LKTKEEILEDTGMFIKRKEDQYELNLNNLNSDQIDFFRSLPMISVLKENYSHNPFRIKFTGFNEFDTIKPICDVKNNPLIEWNKVDFILYVFYNVHEPLDFKGKYYYFKPLHKKLVIEKYEHIIKEQYINVKDMKTMFDFTIHQRNPILGLDFTDSFVFRLNMKEDNLNEIFYTKEKGNLNELETNILIDIAEHIPRKPSHLYKKWEKSISYQEYLDILFDLEKNCFINCSNSIIGL